MSGLDLVILGKATEVAEPGEGAFDDPTLGQDDKAMRVDTFDDFCSELTVPGQSSDPIEETSGVTAIHEESLEPTVAP